MLFLQPISQNIHLNNQNQKNMKKCNLFIGVSAALLFAACGNRETAAVAVSDTSEITQIVEPDPEPLTVERLAEEFPRGAELPSGDIDVDGTKLKVVVTTDTLVAEDGYALRKTAELSIGGEPVARLLGDCNWAQYEEGFPEDFNYESVVGLEILSPKIRTASGIGVGMAVEDLVENLDNAEIWYPSYLSIGIGEFVTSKRTPGYIFYLNTDACGKMPYSDNMSDAPSPLQLKHVRGAFVSKMKIDYYDRGF